MFSSNNSSMQKAYQAVVMEGKWGDLEKFLDDGEGFTIAYQRMTVAEDTAFHIAVHSKSEQPLKKLLDRFANNDEADEQILTTILHTTNAYDNTVLHEAAINHNIKAVKLLVGGRYVTPRQLLERNESGETPLFKAAVFGSTKVVKYLASQPNQTISSAGYKKLKDAHRINNDGFSILHAAVRGEHFGTALCLLKMDKELAGLKTKNGMTSLHLLTNSKSAFTDKYYNQLFHRLFSFYGKWPTIVTQIWKEKRKPKFAFMLAKELIKIDDSWEISNTEDTSKRFRPNAEDVEVEREIDGTDAEMPEVETPLLAATRIGVIELVKEILNVHPQAVEHVSHKKQNILHVAASYRQREIFDHVTKIEIPTRRLIMGIDKDGYTVLHHVADNTNYTGGNRPGPAYQLQEELEWFQMVEEIMPSFFTQHHDKSKKTAEVLFREKHENQLDKAQKWLKATSQSCSAVAVLVATVVFAAAFTVPGGNDQTKGFPLLLHNHFFKAFTLTDVVSLSCSLTALALFLSILTSPFELENFRASLPRRLTLGFALLFMSVATTMVTFTFTVILIIQSDHRQQWRLTLICCAAFFPVSVLALTHFPLFHSFITAWKYFFKFIWSAPPFRFLHKLVH